MSVWRNLCEEEQKIFWDWTFKWCLPLDSDGKYGEDGSVGDGQLNEGDKVAHGLTHQPYVLDKRKRNN